MRTHPLQNFVLIKPLEVEHGTMFGICNSGSHIDQTNSGAVIAASAGMKLTDGNWHPLNVKVGDKNHSQYDASPRRFPTRWGPINEKDALCLSK